MAALADRRLDRDLDQVGGAGGGLAGAALRVGPGDVEVTQRAMVERMGGGDVGQHALGHQLGPAIGIDRLRARILPDRHLLGDAVGRRRRGEDEVPDPALHRALDQRAALHRIVLIIFERVLDALRHHDRAAKWMIAPMPCSAISRPTSCLVGDVALREHRAFRHRPAKAGDELSITTTGQPASSSASTAWLPI
jgi:hypothetical protein